MVRDMSSLPLKLNAASVVGVEYDAQSKTLKVPVEHGRRYKFENVPPEVHRDFMSASDQQRYFDAHINNGRYPAREVSTV